MDIKNLQTKDIAITDLKFDDDDDDKGIFTGHGAIFGNIDFDNDIIMPGAFLDSLKVRMPKLLFQHNSSQPIGKFLEAKEDEKGLFLRGQLADTEKGQEVRKLLKMGALDGMSVGFITRKAQRDEDGVRRITEVDLFETSIVTFPANERASVENVKSVEFADLAIAPVDQEWLVEAAEAKLKEFTKSDEIPSCDYKKAFLSFDCDDVDNFKSYQFPIADVVDGEMKAIPKALFAASAAIAGDKYPDDFKSQIEVIERYYEKMGRESPFKKGITASEVREASLSHIEQMLFNGTKFARSGADWIVKQITRRKGGKEEGCQQGSEKQGQLSELAELADKFNKTIKGV